MPPHKGLPQAALFVAVSGAGWLLDVTVFLLLSGPAGWPVLAANLASGSCGALLVFAASSWGIFRRNGGPMAQKAGVLLVFNAGVIVVSSAMLAALAAQLAAGAARWGVDATPGMLRLAAKVLVTPFTLLLNFVVVRFLVERFVDVRGVVSGVAR